MEFGGEARDDGQVTDNNVFLANEVVEQRRV